jgi:dihydrofolate reductase
LTEPSKILWHVTMSLDGFITGPDDTMDWMSVYSDPNVIADETRDATGAILAGRRWYDVARARYDGVGGIYGGSWRGPVFVLTHRPDDVPDDSSVTFLSSSIEDAVATARAAAGRRGVGIFGANVARQCLDRGILDEVVIHLAPVLVGDGVHLYENSSGTPVRLERITVGESGQLTDLRFRVRKQPRGA